MVIGVAVAALLAAGGADARISPPPGWRWYNNARIDFSICYPPQLHADAESDSGDGTTFGSKDGAEARAYGEFRGDERITLAQRQHELEGELSGLSGRVTYRAHGSSWFAISGVSGPTTFYAKVFKRGSDLIDYQLMYPSRLAPKWDPVAAQMSRCFAYGPAPY